MRTVTAPTDVERFRATVTRRLGLQFDNGRLQQLEELLRRRAEAHAAGIIGYLDGLETADFCANEFRVLAQELTVAETYFFRHGDQFRAYAEVALPLRMRAQEQSRTLRILSAGCASGEEPYSLAMAAQEALPRANNWRIAIHGVDVNPSVIQRANRAYYSAWSLRETPAATRERWFRPVGREFALDEGIRAMVTFEEGNLVEEDSTFWGRERYDVIFCRNVIMYLAPEPAQALIACVTHALAPDGFLFLGHAETLRGLSQAFHLCHTHGTFYYRRKDRFDASRPRRTDESRQAGPSNLSEPPVIDLDGATSWVEAIQRASDRIHAITTRRPESAPAPGAPKIAAGPSRLFCDLGHAIDLLRAERFAEALDQVRDLPPESAADPEALLLYAVLLTHGGKLLEAERVCKDLLTRDDMNAGARYLMALCREGAGDPSGAVEQDQVAIYLDPGFAMPHLHLGFLARRAGDHHAARGAFERALVLLQREDPLRLLFFGGGFNRDSLLALCRAEVAACGGTE
ncbi:MAG: protein-glutamate O-methyltransferase [Candidatus Hydrogenedentes bacterium]|nr:protein-glutamate O-methyltransferase [Candidatus Hydrogenedentota bacterium]